MKGFLKFFALVVVLVPAWIAFLTLSGDKTATQQAESGPLVVVDAALSDAWSGTWVSGATAMTPLPSTDTWAIEGFAAAVVQDETKDAAGEAVSFRATLHSTCLPLSNPDCWTVKKLDVPAASVVAEAVAEESVSVETASKPATEIRGEKLLIVQEQLRSMNFDPGPSDGVFGTQTRTAVEAYIARTDEAPGTGDARTAQALAELEALGRVVRGGRQQADGDYHGAFGQYAKAQAVDPTNAQSYFNRGLAYQEMGLPSLAIDQFGAALERKDDHVIAHHSRGNAYFEAGDYWRGFADHANSLGIRYLGHQYLTLTNRVSEGWTKVEPQLEVLFDWAQTAWQATWERVKTYA